MRVISIDCAFDNLGYVFAEIKGSNAIILDAGVIETRESRPQTKPRNGGPKKRKGPVREEDWRRCEEWGKAFDALIEEKKPDAVIGELPGGSQSASAAKKMGMSTLGAVVITSLRGIQCQWVTEQRVKKTAAEMMMEMGLPNKATNKNDIMNLVLKKYGMMDEWPLRRFKNGKPPEIIKGKFEHIADAVIVLHCIFELE